MIVTVTLNPAVDQTVQLDRLQLGAVNKVRDVTETAGGKGINVARVLADLGEEVVATGLMGQRNQQFFSHYLTEHQITDKFISVEGSVRSNIKLVNGPDAEVTDINFPGFQATENDLSLVLEVIKNAPAETFVAVCGSLPPGINALAYGQFLRAIKSLGYRLAVDTSGEALKRAVAVKPDLIKPNIHELSELADQELSIESGVTFANQLIEQGINQVVLSCGEEGAWFINKYHRCYARPDKVKVVSTVGAGDSMMAGYLFGLSKNYALEQTAGLATACGMKAVTQAGVGGFTLEDLKDFISGGIIP
ncbi:1-phosphofructokinase [Endozoicomonas sp. Mp262]|uniref:1-phosphofructokinase n=1 Tax=Endozoicomonas sp. Mp262 TaxID=2919499 RepID=UPI0021D95B4D